MRSAAATAGPESGGARSPWTRRSSGGFSSLRNPGIGLSNPVNQSSHEYRAVGMAMPFRKVPMCDIASLADMEEATN
jgi:hypothetical protein